MSLLLLLDEDSGTPATLGVLKVNVGTSSTPDWRKIGCGGGASAPATFADDFNRNDGANNFGLSGGALSWESVGSHGLWAIASNQATVWNAASGNLLYIVTETGGSDGTIDVDLALCSAGPAGLTFRHRSYLSGGVTLHEMWTATRTGLASFDAVRFDSNGFVLSGTVTTVATWAALSIPATLRVTLAGSSITVTNVTTGTTLYSGTSTLGQTNTRHGLSGTSQSFTTLLDNFTATITPAPTPGRLKLWTGSGWVREKCDDDGALSGTADLDTFNRSDSSTLGTASGGLVYTNTTGGPAVVSNQAKQGDGAANFLNVGSGDHYVQITFTPGASAPGRARLFVKRDVGDNHSYSASFDSGPGSNLHVTVDRYVTNLGVFDTGIAWSTSTTYRVSLAFVVATRTLTVTATDGTTTYSHSIAEPNQGWDADVKVGFQLTGADVVADDLSATPLTLTAAHPLKVYDGTTWQHAACMVPA